MDRISRSDSVPGFGKVERQDAPEADVPLQGVRCCPSGSFGSNEEAV
ncbi:MAG: hypothetical protein LBB05_00055 [Puniceicoccales bacterium]|jgi:hypothetical protein|nr:hypothetical protein [Puniceicoccales bacterium]